jgi:hypothetical protein
VHRAPKALGHDERAALVSLRQQQRELLTGYAGGLVDAALPLERVLGNRLKGGIARRVSLPLVDGTEAVDVADHHRERALGAHRALELELELLLEGAPVQEPRQRVCAVRVVDPRAQPPDARVLEHGGARQRESAGGGKKHSEDACRPHFPVVIGGKRGSLEGPADRQTALRSASTTSARNWPPAARRSSSAASSAANAAR